MGLGYGLTYDTRRTGLNPNAGVRLRFGQDLNGLGGDVSSVVTSALATAETKVLNEEVTLRAGEYAINPPGVWHIAHIETEATAVFITAGEGTQHRPR